MSIQHALHVAESKEQKTSAEEDGVHIDTDPPSTSEEQAEASTSITPTPSASQS